MARSTGLGPCISRGGWPRPRPFTARCWSAAGCRLVAGRTGRPGLSARAGRGGGGPVWRGVGVRPDSVRLHANLGEALRILGRLDEALDHLRKALALDAGLRKRGTAWACWRTISGVLPMRSPRAGRRSGSTLGSQRLTSTWAMLLQALHRPVEAIEAMRTALRIEPDNSRGSPTWDRS